MQANDIFKQVLLDNQLKKEYGLTEKMIKELKLHTWKGDRLDQITFHIVSRAFT